MKVRFQFSNTPPPLPNKMIISIQMFHEIKKLNEMLYKYICNYNIIQKIHDI